MTTSAAIMRSAARLSKQKRTVECWPGLDRTSAVPPPPRCKRRRSAAHCGLRSVDLKSSRAAATWSPVQPGTASPSWPSWARLSLFQRRRHREFLGFYHRRPQRSVAMAVRVQDVDAVIVAVRRPLAVARARHPSRPGSHRN